MSSVLYIANVRLPTEKAHGYQIVQMCEAFAADGTSVVLVVPRRANTLELSQIRDVWKFYGVARNFEILRLPCIDLMQWSTRPWAFHLQTLTFLASLLFWQALLCRQKFRFIFTRDLSVAALVCVLGSAKRLVYEVHSLARSERSRRVQRWVLQNACRVVGLTAGLRERIHSLSGRSDVVVEHDAVRLTDENETTREDTRQAVRGDLGIPMDAFVACYAGRLHTMGMSKGLEMLVDAAPQVDGLYFLLVGGPEEDVVALRERWGALGLNSGRFLAVGTVAPPRVPMYLAASDVCVITSPANEFFSFETSPMKLFEYMAARRPIVASDLPSTREILTDGIHALLFTPGDAESLGRCLARLRDDGMLRRQLSEAAYEKVGEYTWRKRASRILSNIPKG